MLRCGSPPWRTGGQTPGAQSHGQVLSVGSVANHIGNKVGQNASQGLLVALNPHGAFRQPDIHLKIMSGQYLIEVQHAAPAQLARVDPGKFQIHIPGLRMLAFIRASTSTTEKRFVM